MARNTGSGSTWGGFYDDDAGGCRHCDDAGCVACDARVLAGSLAAGAIARGLADASQAARSPLARLLIDQADTGPWDD